MADMAIVYCPRCDKSYAALTRTKAMARLLGHVKRNHPDQYDDFKDSD